MSPRAHGGARDLRDAMIMTPTALSGLEVLVLQMRFTASFCDSMRVGT